MKIEKLSGELDRIVKEAKEIQDAHEGKSMATEVVQKWQGLLAEGQKIQKAIEDAKVLEGLEEVQSGLRPEPTILAPNSKPNGAVAGFVQAGALAVLQGGMKLYGERGYPKGDVEIAQIGSLLSRHGRAGYVPVNAEQRKALETQAIPVIGSEVIAPDRIEEIVRFEERNIPRLRDLISALPTSSDTVRYRRISARTDAAAKTARGEGKPESATSFAVTSVPIGKVAVWQPVAEEDLSDWPQIAGLIQNELVPDVDNEVERLMLRASADQSFDGLLTNGSVASAREVLNDTLIDTIRRMITDVFVANLTPNGVLMHPLDFEALQLTKDDADGQYIYVVVTEAGVSRIWGQPIVQSNFMADPDTDERHVLVADWRRAIRVWDRMRTSIRVGFNGTDFTDNTRTILAECRLASKIIRPAGVLKYVTAEAS